MKFLPEFHGQFYSKNDGFHIVSVDMKYRRPCHFGNIGTISTRACLQVIGGKTNLIINHQVNGPPGFIACQLRHLKHFVNNSLCSNGSVAMNNDGRYLIVIAIVMSINS